MHYGPYVNYCTSVLIEGASAETATLRGNALLRRKLSKIAPLSGLLPSIEMLEGKRQHRPLIGVGKLQRLTLDLARKFVAQHTAAEWGEKPAMIVELREDFSASPARLG